MIKLLKSLHTLRLAPNSPDTDRCVEILKEELPFTVHEFHPGEEINGWIVPYSWSVEKAEIRKNGVLVYDGLMHPLGVMGYAKPFSGRVTLDELKRHVTYRQDWPNAIGYHCDYYYKPWLADWGFSIPYSLYTALEDGEYDIDLRTSYSSGTMKVCEYYLPGEREETVVFNAHNCHAGQANDDISGCVAGIELIKKLSAKKRRFSYRLIICPEHLGTVFYLRDLAEEQRKMFMFCIFLEALGNNNRLALQKSFTGDSLIDRAFLHYLHHQCSEYHVDDFRKIIGNDETVWESPGYEIPTVSVSRFPFPEYHTNMDNEDIILNERLGESVTSIIDVLDILESDCRIRRNFTGLVALSNPKYNLYISPGTDPSIPGDTGEDRKKWNYLMDCLPRYFDEKTTILDIAQKHRLPYRIVYEYILKYQEKELVEFV